MTISELIIWVEEQRAKGLTEAEIEVILIKTNYNDKKD